MLDKTAEQINIILFKSVLIETPTDVLPDMLPTKDDYIMFLKAVNSILTEDPTFFLISDEILKKAENTMYKIRFAYKDELIINTLSEIIVKFNKLKNIDKKTKKESVRLYIAEQEQKREVPIRNTDDLLFMISHDASVMDAMLEGRSVRWRPSYFLSSTNYLVKTIPEFYQEFEEIREQTIKNLELITENKRTTNFIVRKFANRAIQNVQKVKTKEE